MPTPSVNNDDRFGTSIDISSEFMVVGAENSDTTGVLYGGAAYVFQKTVAGWAYRATLTPSDPDEYDFFGNEVAIDAAGTTIVVINRNYNQGTAYIFERPATGWTSMQETANIKFPEYLEFNSALDISADGATIAVSNPMSNNGMLYVLHKPLSGWSSELHPETVVTRSEGSGIWIGSDVIVEDDHIYASTGNEGNPAIYVYKASNGGYSLHATLSTSLPASVLGYFGMHLTINGNTIAASGLAYESDLISQRIFVFHKAGPEWTDMQETYQFQLPDLISYRFPYPIQLTSVTELAVAVLVKDNDYYTGKIAIIETNDNTWRDYATTDLYEETNLTMPAEFGNQMAWNGNDLVVVAGRKYSGPGFRNSAISLTKSGGQWGSLQQVTLPRFSSSNSWFGASVVKTQDVLFAGAPYDNTKGPNTGAVYIYNQQGSEFSKVGAIFPSARKTRPDGGKDMAFGMSMSVFNDELAIGAPSFKYAENQFGKIFLYKRIVSDWTTTFLYDSLTVPPDLALNHVGAEIAMNDQVLFASAYNNLNNEHTNAVVVFEKMNGKWIYKQLIKLGRPLDKSWPSAKLSLNGNQLAVGESFTIDGGLSIFGKNPDTQQWERTALIGAGVFSGFGAAVKLLDDHLFVGAPWFDYNNVYRAGAVAVFTKLPGQSWDSNMEASGLIGAKEPIEGASFGSSIDVVANTLVVGAPGAFLTLDNQVRTVPGNCYVIQSHDYYWTNTTQYLNLQGERYANAERDHFGAAVTIDENHFYIGSRNETTASGKFSGAVYYVPTPPLVFLQPPVCLGQRPLALRGYPFGGTWSGPGVDQSGAFDPSVTGPGIFTLLYSTVNCSHQGNVQIEVKDRLTVSAISPTNVEICSAASTTLSVDPIPEASYAWYYKADNANSFKLLTGNSPSYNAKNPGEYKALVSKSCSSESPVFTVGVEDFPVSVGPQPIVCSRDEKITLVSSVANGMWEGPGIVSNAFTAANLTNGAYQITYTVTTPGKCTISLVDEILVNVLNPIQLTQLPTDFCETGSAQLTVSPQHDALTYKWFYRASPSLTPVAIEADLATSASVFAEGYYQVVASDGKCSAASNELTVGLSGSLSYTLLPAENSQTEVCDLKEYKISIKSDYEAGYTWLYKAENDDTYEIIGAGDSGEIMVTESGLYIVRGQNGFCSFETAPVLIKFNNNEVFVPNVFTPNGDDKNPVFKVSTANPISTFSIFNRNGREVYSSPSGEWNGGDAPPGVYFWRLTYAGCDGIQELKGWVQLLR